MGSGPIRILSDVHYADRSSRVRSLSQLAPLFDGASSLVLNGDTTDTRRDRIPERTEENRRHVLDFLGSREIPVTILTGNHDPDLSDHHTLDLADGRILVTHGDIVFNSIVPWSGDAGILRRRVKDGLASIAKAGSATLEGRLAVFRRVSASVPQRHQGEKKLIRYVLRLACDTVWPPHRGLAILYAWRVAPGRVAELALRHRPKAKFVIVGHTHKPLVWKSPSGVTVINTGSFCLPFGGFVAELDRRTLRVRRIEPRGGLFHPGRLLAEFSLP